MHRQHEEMNRHCVQPEKGLNQSQERRINRAIKGKAWVLMTPIVKNPGYGVDEYEFKIISVVSNVQPRVVKP
jgi:hypothetical protein